MRRYDLPNYYCCKPDVEAPDGEWVRFEDVARREERAEAIKVEVTLVYASLAKAERQRDELLKALKAVAAYIDDHIDINANGGPNWAMRFAQEHGDAVAAAIAAAEGTP